MNNQPSITTAWTCNCGHVNSLENRCCSNCGQHMPSEISQRVYEEEILLHNGVLIDGKNRTLIITAAIILALVFWRVILFAIAILAGIISVIFEWLYIWESAKDMNEVKPLKLKKYILDTFVFSLSILIIVRIAISGMEIAVHTGIRIFLVGWIISFILAIISSSITKEQNEIIMNNNIRTIAVSCVPKIICLAIILLLI